MCAGARLTGTRLVSPGHRGGCALPPGRFQIGAMLLTKARQEMLEASRKQAAAAERAMFHQRTGKWVN